MGWPEALVIGFNVAQVCFLAWLAARQQQVKRALNGNASDVIEELREMHHEIRRVFRPPDDALRLPRSR